MDNSIVADEYQLLVEECKANFFTRIGNSREELILAYGELGCLIVTSPLYEKSGKGSGQFIEKLCEDAKIGKRNGYYAVQFYKEYLQKHFPSYNDVCTGVQTLIKEEFEANISWSKLKDKYLSPAKTIDEKVEEHLRESSMVEVEPLVAEAIPEDMNNKVYSDLDYLSTVKLLKKLSQIDPEAKFINIQVSRVDSKWTVTVVSDKKIIPTAKASQCPLEVDNEAFAFLKEKYPNGHKECIQYITEVQSQDKGHKFVNFPKQIMNVHKILRAGFDFEDMDRVIELIKKDQFYQQKGWDMSSVSQKLEKA